MDSYPFYHFWLLSLGNCLNLDEKALLIAIYGFTYEFQPHPIINKDPVYTCMLYTW